MLEIWPGGLCCDLGSVDYVVILWFVVDCSFVCGVVASLLCAPLVPSHSDPFSILIQSVPQQSRKRNDKKGFVLFSYNTRTFNTSDRVQWS